MRSINMRYLGQNYEHEVALPDQTVTPAVLGQAFASFAEMHRARYGYEIEGETIELVSFKVTVIGRRPGVELREPARDAQRAAAGARDVFFRAHGWTRATVLHRSALAVGDAQDGPALVQEDGSTTLVPPGMTARKSERGSLILTTSGDQ
jgi:N-methylhydantoinase A